MRASANCAPSAGRCTLSAFAWSPSNRTWLNSVLTIPGEMTVTLIGVPTRSWRHAVVYASTANLRSKQGAQPWGGAGGGAVGGTRLVAQ